MPANLENSAVATGLEKVRFYSSPKEKQCLRMFKPLCNCTHLTYYQSDAQNSPSQTSTECEPWNSRCADWFYKRQRNERSNCQYPLDHQKTKKNIYFCFIDYAKAFDCVVHNKLWKILKRMGKDHLTCLLRNLYGGQEATVRTGRGTTDWCQIRKWVCQGCILSPCLFNLHAEYIMRNAGLEAQAGIKIARGNIKNLRFADDITRMAESKEELNGLLMKVKQESE